MSARTYTEKEIVEAAARCGASIDIGRIDRIDDPGGGPPRCDLRSTIVRFGREEREAREASEGATAFMRLNQGAMSAYDASDWDDHATARLYEAIDAREDALALAAVERALEQRPDDLPAERFWARLQQYLEGSGPAEEVRAVLDLLASAKLAEMTHAERIEYLDMLVDHYDLQYMDEPAARLPQVLRVARAYVRMRAGLTL